MPQTLFFCACHRSTPCRKSRLLRRRDYASLALQQREPSPKGYFSPLIEIGLCKLLPPHTCAAAAAASEVSVRVIVTLCDIKGCLAQLPWGASLYEPELTWKSHNFRGVLSKWFRLRYFLIWNCSSRSRLVQLPKEPVIKLFTDRTFLEREYRNT